MKHCKTLFVLLSAAIVMLTAGCSRQTVHPVPIRYNFLDQIPDADPMLLDTDFVSAILPVPGETLPAAGSAAMKHQPAPIRYRFEVASEPDCDPMLQEANEMLEACLVGGSVASKPAPAPDCDPMLQEAPQVGGSVASKPAPIRYRFEVASDPDHDPILPEANGILEAFQVGGSMASKPAPIRYRFEVASDPDHDPMLLEETGLVKEIADPVVIPARKADARQREAAGVTATSLARIFR